MSTTGIRGLVLLAPGELEIQHFDQPTVGNDDALLKPELVGLCGTDIHTYEGTMPYPFPLLLGHEIVGTIAEAGDGFVQRHEVTVGDRVTVGATVPCNSCGACKVGKIRFCESPDRRGYGSWASSETPPFLWGGMADVMYLAPNSVLRKIDGKVSPASALVGHTIFANGMQWLKFVGKLEEGESVLIQGCGPLGVAAALAAKTVKAKQVFVAGLERDQVRLSHVASFGCVPVRADEVDVASFVVDNNDGNKVDLVLNVTGAPASVTTSVDSVKWQGRVLLAGLGGPEAQLQIPMDQIVRNEISLLGCYGKSNEAHLLINELLPSDPSLRGELERLITHTVSIDAVAAILSRESDVLDAPETIKIVAKLGEEE